MSILLTMAPLAVAIAATTTGTGYATVSAFVSANNRNMLKNCPAVETSFTSIDMLKKTLEDHEASVNVIRNHECLTAECCGGTLMYQKDSATSAISMRILSVTDPDELDADLRDLKDEYGMNVQEFTYHKIKESLPPDMSIETEDVDDDDAIQLVINIQ